MIYYDNLSREDIYHFVEKWITKELGMVYSSSSNGWIWYKKRNIKTNGSYGCLALEHYTQPEFSDVWWPTGLKKSRFRWFMNINDNYWHIIEEEDPIISITMAVIHGIHEVPPYVR